MNNVISFNRLPITPSNTESDLTASNDRSPVPVSNPGQHNTEAHLRADPVARLVEERIRAWRARAPHAPLPAPPMLPITTEPRRICLASRLTLIAGAATIALGVPLGCISMAFLGPLGVMVSVAAAAAGSALIILAYQIQRGTHERE